LGAEVGRYLVLGREEINQDWRKVHNFIVLAPHYIISSRRLEMGGGNWYLRENLRKKDTWETLT